MKKRVKLKKKNCLLLLLTTVFLFSTINIVLFLIDTHKNNNDKKKLIHSVIDINKDDSKDDEIKVDFEKLLSKNKDTKGWIRYNQKKIDYPIVQANNNSYYLKKSFDGNTNQAGAIFMDYRNTSFDDKNVVLFGHAMPDDSMFGSIDDLFKDSFFDKDKNKYIKIVNLDNQILTYQIFSYYIIKKEEYYITTSFESNEAFSDFINTISKRSYKTFNVNLSTDDNILTLSTCSGTGNTNKRKVVHAKLVKKE